MSISLKVLTLVFLLSLIACNRSTMPYGGVTADKNSPPYTQQLDVNYPPAGNQQ